MDTLRLWLCLCICATGIASAQTNYGSALKGLQPQATPSGLLLGISNDDGYQTLFVEYANKKATLTANCPLLAVPQGSRFAYVYKRTHDSLMVLRNELGENEHVQYREHWEEIITEYNRKQAERHAEDALADDAPPQAQCDTCPQWEWDDYIDIQYVIPGHITLTTSGSGYTGGAHPNSYNNAFTMHFTPAMPSIVNHSNDSNQDSLFTFTTVENLYPVQQNPDVISRMNRELFIKGKLEYFIDNVEDTSLYESYDSTEYIGVPLESIEGRNESVDTSSIDIVLERVKGLVRLKCQADMAATYVESGDYTLTAEYDCGALAPPYISYNNFPLRYDAFVQKDGTVQDVFISPQHNVVYVLAGDTLHGISVETGKNVFQYMLPEGSEVIMVEWTTGEQLKQWKAALLQ